MLKYSSHFSTRNGARSTTRRSMSRSSAALNPPLRFKSNGIQPELRGSSGRLAHVVGSCSGFLRRLAPAVPGTTRREPLLDPRTDQSRSRLASHDVAANASPERCPSAPALTSPNATTPRTATGRSLAPGRVESPEPMPFEFVFVLVFFRFLLTVPNQPRAATRFTRRVGCIRMLDRFSSRFSSLTPCPAARAARDAAIRLENSGWFSSL